MGRALFAILLIAPSLILPVSVWHHHVDQDEAAHCALCAVPNSPAAITPPVDPLLAERPIARAAPIPPCAPAWRLTTPVQARAPPS